MQPDLLSMPIVPTEPLGWADISLRLGLAVLFGAIIGFERAIADKPADARTMMLISGGTAGFILLGVQFAAAAQPDQGMMLDPSRVLAYVVSGVGFLGAGAILHSKKTVLGLTTAASIWAAAAIGCACGLAQYPIAIGLLAVAVITLWVPWIRQLPRGGSDSDSNSDG